MHLTSLMKVSVASHIVLGVRILAMDKCHIMLTYALIDGLNIMLISDI